VARRGHQPHIRRAPMNKVGVLLAELHDAETGLAAEWRVVGERQAAEHDIRRKTSELLGHRPEPGLLLLHDLLDQVTALHKQTLTQIKWLKTRIRHACPQILLVPG
jgi:hypothetical protein